MAEEHPSHIVKKSTIMKTRIGCVKTSTYDLPAAGHVYGKKNEEGGVSVEESKPSML
jgi:hypothetical protein